MTSPARALAVSAALLLALATIIGALGAHALRGRLGADHYEILQTAVNYQFFHSLGLLGVSLWLERVAAAVLRLAAWLLLAGIVLFSGSLYLLLAGAPAIVGVLTPIGGLALILSWVLVAFVMARAVPRTTA